MPTISIDPLQLRERAAVYRLLGRLWLAELDGDLLRELRSAPLRDAFQAAGGELPPEEMAEEDTLEELAIDFCQLFLGPSGHLPPHQSVWAEGHFQGSASADTARHYAALNLPAPDGMADHLGQQLAAMAQLLERWSAQPSVTASELEAARQFFSERLAWTEPLCQLAATRAQSTFYRSMVTMSQSFLSEEKTAWLVDA